MNQFLLSLMTFFVFTPVAFADATATQGAPSAMSQGLLLGGFVAIFYFLIWRPQSKRAKAHRQLLTQLEKGDEVITNGGLIGCITLISNDFVVISVSDNMEVTIQKQAIASSLPKGTLKSIK